MPRRSTIIITEKTIKAAITRSRRYEIRDADLPGFFLRVNPNGSKSFYVQLDRTRKRKIGEAGAMTATVARYRAADMQRRHRRQATGPDPGEPATRPATLTLAEFLQREHWASTRRGRHAPGSGYSSFRRLSAALGELGAIDLGQLTFSQIEHWKLRRSHRVKAATVNREMAILRRVMRSALARGWIARDPTEKLHNLRQAAPRPARPLTDPERRRVRQALLERNDHMRPITLLALHAGLRQREVLGLQWRDLNLGARPAILVSGIRPGRRFPSLQAGRMPLIGSVAEELRRWQAQSGRWGPLVFRNSSGGQLRTIQTGWQSLMHAARVYGFRFTDCRHDYAGRLIRAGLPLGHVRDLLGLSSLAQLERYAHFTPGSIHESVDRFETYTTDSEAAAPETGHP